MLSKFIFSTALVGTSLILPTLSVQAQIIPDNSLGSESSIVVPNVNINGINSDRIDGGAIRGSNLFHSFQEFNIDNGRGAYFSNPGNISNILTRVTGSNISNIFGTLGVLGNANLFLINPNGIVFGPNARLDVGGSFFASTADSILFENSVEFAASNPDAPPLLTINIPIGLNFRESPGDIVNQSIPNNFDFLTVSGLYVPPEETIALIGGEVRFEGGVIASAGSRIELGGLSEPGIVELNTDGSLSFPPNIQRADILLTDVALAVVAGNPGGTVAINAQNLEISGGSQIGSGISNMSNPFDSIIEEDRETGIFQAGDVTINATDSIILTDENSTIANQVFSDSTGNAGNIDIQTNLLSISNGALISTSTSGNGNGGNLTITATNIELFNSSANPEITSGLGTSVQPGGVGNAGSLTINTQNLSVRDGARIETTTFANGDGGNLIVNATDIELVGRSANDEFASGLGASVNSGATGNAGSLTINTERLVVQDGAQVGAATFGNGNGGNLIVNATDIELVGTSANGAVASGLGASVNPGGVGNGGSLTINTQNLSVRDGAQIGVGIFGNGDGGNLIVNAKDIELIGTSADSTVSSALAASIQPGATGKAGSLIINTQNLSIQDGAQVGAATFGNGNGGDLTITAKDIELVGTSANPEVPSSLATSVQPGAEGNGGSLTINTQNLSIRDGAQIEVGTSGNGNGGSLTINTQNLFVRDGALVSARTSGNGNGGSLTVNATEIELIGTSADGELISGLTTSVTSGGVGNAGSLIINTQNLSVRDGAQVGAAIFGNGDGGNLIVTATEIELVGTSADGEFASGLRASIQPGAIGNAGSLIINTQNLSVRDGAQVGASTFGNGDGGNLTITATDIELVGTSSALGASVEFGGVGKGGSLIINTQNLSVRDGAFVSAATFGNGNGGNLTITATDIELVGASENTHNSSTALFTSALSTSTGRAGTLNINTENLTVQDEAIIDVRSDSTEAAGNLIINAPNILLDNQASLNGETTAGEGNIILNTSDLRLRNNSNITTNAIGEATGGNITINTETLTALENSDISANAEDAFGGQVTINAVGVFGTAFRTQQSQFSDITATSELGPEFSGTVELNTELDPSSGLIDLTQTVTDPNDLIAQEFCRQRGSSDFVIRGRGGIAVSPNDKSDGSQINVDLVEPVVRRPQNSSQKPSEINNNQPISSLDIIPARGWIRDENGDVILVSYDPTKTAINRQPAQLPQCQSE